MANGKIKKQDSTNTFVVQKNELIHQYSHNLTSRESKVIALLLSTINQKDDASLPAIKIEYSTLMKIIGEKDKLKGRYRIEKFLFDLSQKVFYSLDNPSSTENIHINVMPWFVNVAINYNNEDQVVFFLNPFLHQYLLRIRSNFTKYSLGEVLDFKSPYAFKLFDLLQSNSYRGTFDIKIRELRAILNLDNQYEETSKFHDFREMKRRILVPCIDEINEKTSMTVSYDVICASNDSRIRESIRFTVEENKAEDPEKKSGPVQFYIERKEDESLQYPFTTMKVISLL